MAVPFSRYSTGKASSVNTRSRFVLALLALLTVVAGLTVGAAAGLGVSTTLLIAALLGPFFLLITFVRPHWAVAGYLVLIYADLLSILVRFHGLPPLARFAGFVLLVAVVGRKVVKGEKLVGDRMTWWLAAYGILLVLSLVYAQSPDLTMVELVEFVRNFLTYLLVINSLTTPDRLRNAMFALLAMAVLLASLTVFQTVTGQFDNDFGGLAQAHVSGITETTDAPRPGGTLGDPNYYGQSLLIILPLALFAASTTARGTVRTVGAFASVVIVAAIIFTYSRGDTLALAALLLAAAIYKRPRFQYVLGGFVALGLMLALLPSTYFERINSLLSVLQNDQQSILTESSLKGRAGAASAAISMFADYPILGVGRGNYPLHELDYIEGTNLASKSQGIPPHDLYLEIASEQGAVGLFIMGGILLTSVRALAYARRRFLQAGKPEEADLAAWLGIGLFGYLVSSLFLHGAFLYMLWLQVALIVALYQVAIATLPVSPPGRRTSRLMRAIRVREEPAASKVVTTWLAEAGAALPASKPARRSLNGLLAGVLIALAAVGIFGVAGEYASRKPTASATQAVAVAGSSGVAGAGSLLEAAPTPRSVTFSQTGFQVSDPFLMYWEDNGGAPLFGYPISSEILEVSTDGRVLRVQYFERARLEYHPESEDPAQQIQLGKLGVEAARTGDPARSLPVGLSGTQVVLHEGSPSTPPLFAAFWKSAGDGLIGYPISSVLVDKALGGEQIYTQYFERARLEYHPDETADRQVQVSRLGTQVFQSKHGNK